MERGYVGFGLFFMWVGDIVVIFFGVLIVYFVWLMVCEGYFEFFGDGYCDGVMDGEVWDEIKVEIFFFVWFMLCFG